MKQRLVKPVLKFFSKDSQSGNDVFFYNYVIFCLWFLRNVLIYKK